MNKHLFQEYSQEIDRLKVELQAAREKDGVFLPKDNYDHLMLLEKSRGEEITNITKLLKTKEAELEKFEVCIRYIQQYPGPKGNINVYNENTKLLLDL